MAEHFADRLCDAVRRKNSRLCVGLDPRLDLLPPDLPGSGSDPIRRVESFCFNICLATAPYAAAVKPQSAYFEALGAEGVACLEKVMCFARELGLLVILDAKRNDIGSTAEAYAEAYLAPRASGPCGHVSPADAITVNAYLGFDGVEPFLNKAQEHGSGLFILVKTSNAGSGQLQDLRLHSGETVYEHMGNLVAQWGQGLVGASGYSSVGAVVGATYPSQLEELRARLPQVPFLVPGFGHQGASANDVAVAFDDEGLGAIVNSARGIIYAYRKREGSFTEAAAAAAQEARDDLNAACHGGTVEA
jgi:orotidine-5'-phosphate decarboxylase